VTPLMNQEQQPARLESGYPGVLCGTGDSFVTAADDWLLEQKVDLVDMDCLPSPACATIWLAVAGLQVRHRWGR
jgi:hypothetical protein